MKAPVKSVKTVKLNDGAKGLYITFGTADHEAPYAVTARMLPKERQADAMKRLMAGPLQEAVDHWERSRRDAGSARG